MTGPPRVSVVVPAFDGARFLPATLASILGQTFRDLELIEVGLALQGFH